MMAARDGQALVLTLWLSLLALEFVFARGTGSSRRWLLPPRSSLRTGNRDVRGAAGTIEFRSLADLFPYIESQTKRWNVPGGLAQEGQRQLAEDLLRRGVESRVVSMEDERPLELCHYAYA